MTEKKAPRQTALLQRTFPKRLQQSKPVAHPLSSSPATNPCIVAVNMDDSSLIQSDKLSSSKRKLQIGLTIGVVCLVTIIGLAIGLTLGLRARGITSASKTTTTALSTSSTVGVQYGGVNLAGMDFGCVTNGSCYAGFTPPPLSQAAHFTALGMNFFRVPIGWQYLQPSGPGTIISTSIFQRYDAVVQSVFNANPSAKVLVEIHNYARYNGLIIGQDSGAPTNAQFADLWSQIAVKYQNNANIIFGLMNEPHNLNMSQWVVTLQAAVNAIRAAGATTQVITLPGTTYEAAGGFPTVSGIYLSSVLDPIGGTNLLFYDVHQYLDSGYSGTQTTCVTDAVSSSFVPLASYLRANGRIAILSETGGGSTPSCELYVASELAYLNANYDVFYGFTGWAAGSFSTSYALSMVPFANGTDQAITLVFAAAIKQSSLNSSTTSTAPCMVGKDALKTFLAQELLIVSAMKILWSCMRY